jgi:hypothetical protein
MITVGKLLEIYSMNRTQMARALLKWSTAVKKAAGGMCERCGRGPVEAHHIFRRGTRPTGGWFLMENGIALCVDCHYGYAHSTSLKKIEEFDTWVKGFLKTRRGIEYDDLEAITRVPLIEEDVGEG